MTKLEVGEQYLSATIKAEKMLYLAHKAIMEGNENVSIGIFPNKEREGNQPHFKSEGVAVWVYKKRASGSDNNLGVVEELVSNE